MFVLNWAVLLDVTGSVWFAEAVTSNLVFPGATGVIVRVYFWVSPTLSVPTPSVTTPLLTPTTWNRGSAEVKVRFAGRLAVRFTFVAFEGPVFVTVNV